MIACRRRSVTYRGLPRYLLLVVIFIFGLCAAAMGKPLRTEIIGPRTMTIRGPGGVPKMVHEEAASGQLLVQLRPGTTPAQAAALLQRRKSTVISETGTAGLYVVSLPAGMTVPEGAALWRAEPEVALAEPDRIRYPLIVPNDPLYSSQYQWPRTAAPAAWDMQQGSATTIIAVLDTGYDPDHEDLVAKYWTNQDEAPDAADTDGNGYIDDLNGWDCVDDDNDPDAGPQPGDVYIAEWVSHGTYVAALAAAATNNSIGVAGYDWGAQVMNLRVLGFLGGTDSDIIEGINYAVANGADIINMSLGGPGFSPAFDTPIASAHGAGVVVVCASGNDAAVFTSDPSTWYSPVCNDGPNLGVDNNILGVGATDVNDLAWDEPPYGTNRDASGYNFVDVMAPGVDILSALYYDPASTDFLALYGSGSGTSAAAPIAAGLCGLVLAEYPAYSAAEIIDRLRDTCDDIDALNPMYAGTLGQGRINGAAALGLDVPPDPVTGLQAFDTPGDEGLSITVTWKVSTDDQDDVVGYDLWRAGEDLNNPGNPGSFSALATSLAPGTSGYVDSPVPDETPFWYRVDTRDASNTVPSLVAGPAEARDDLAPPAVETLVAADTQADLGGSISLSWYGYDAPDDLDHYNVYRAEADFTDVSAMTPIGTVASGEGQLYADTSTIDGADYWYAVTGVDDHDNEIRTVTAVGPRTSNPNFSFNFPPGLCIMALGAVPSGSQSRNLGDIFGITDPAQFKVAYYDPSGPASAPYLLYADSPGSAHFDQALGRAWWLRSDQAILVNMSGQPAPEGDFTWDVSPGWQIIGNPYSEDLDFSITEVIGAGQGTPMDLQTSNGSGFTRDYAWAYDPFNNSYRLVSGADLPFATKEIKRGRGVFFLAQKAATLVLKRPAQAAAAQPAAAPEPFDGWQMQLVASAEGLADTDNFLGVSSQAARLNNIVTPPRPDVDLDLYFAGADGARGRRATDFVTSLGEGETWRIRVACSMPGATVRLSWPDLSQLPNDCRPVLTDEATGRSVYLRTTTGYSYEVGEAAGERSFTLKLSAADAQLVIGALAAVATGGGAQVSYTLSEDAAVDAEILNIAGRVVRRLVADRPQDAGPQQIVWDGRNGAGAWVPAGTYFVRLRARAAGGQQVSMVCAVQIGR
jgi:hypothetical protein